MNLIMICRMVCLILDALSQAVNAVIANSVEAGRILLASQQLAECRAQNNPYQNVWMPGLGIQNLQWAADPCQKEQEAVDQLQQQAAAAGNQVATQQLGGAPAPQLATSVDPTPNTDPAIPMNEYIPAQGAQNAWSPLELNEIMEMIVQEAGDVEIDDMDLDEILNKMLYYKLWCPWGLPGTHNLKWKYQPKNPKWISQWLP
nr:nonstructural protein 2 NS2 [Chaphamaparvovirus anseriform 9]